MQVDQARILAIGVLLAGGLAMSAIAMAQPTRQAGGVQEVFGQPMAGINSAVLAKFNYGLGLFRHQRAAWASPEGSVSGVGPLHNARSCMACHIRDGRGAPPDYPAVDGGLSMVMGLTGPDPVYGAQIQDQAVAGLVPEAVPTVRWSEQRMVLADGTEIRLRQPHWGLDRLGYGPLAAATQIDARVAPQLIGLGLLEAVDAATILALADPGDRDGDGISGVAAMVDTKGAPALGRFGWRGAAPSLLAQTARAAHLDMGLSVPDYPVAGGDCTPTQRDCLARAGRDRLDLSDNDIFLLAFYVAHLAVPERRDSDTPLVTRGTALFEQLGCTGCHLASLRTGATAQPEFADRQIAPYTDLLLQDMGPGLAGPAGRQWRTPPLWGIGLTSVVSGHSLLLHDGRARGFSEAIVWHDGEARRARDGFAQLNADDRAALIGFLQSL
ncbi:MAG: di-heme oxidoredictase family protein [Devosia sp.]